MTDEHTTIPTPSIQHLDLTQKILVTNAESLSNDDGPFQLQQKASIVHEMLLSSNLRQIIDVKLPSLIEYISKINELGDSAKDEIKLALNIGFIMGYVLAQGTKST